jgi:hypothetical protein
VEQTAEARKNAWCPLAQGGKFLGGRRRRSPAFEVTLRPKPPPTASDTVKTRAKAPLFVVADTHGEYEILADMLGAATTWSTASCTGVSAAATW